MRATPTKEECRNNRLRIIAKVKDGESYQYKIIDAICIGSSGLGIVWKWIKVDGEDVPVMEHYCFVPEGQRALGPAPLLALFQPEILSPPSGQEALKNTPLQLG